MVQTGTDPRGIVAKSDFNLLGRRLNFIRGNVSSTRVADQIVDTFNAPPRGWEIFNHPAGATAFLQTFDAIRAAA